MQPLKPVAISYRTPVREPLLQYAYPPRDRTWTAEVVWSNGMKDQIDLQALLLEMKVDFYFVDLGVLQTLQEVFEEEIAPAWENKPNFYSRIECLHAIKSAVRGLFMWFISAGYLRETIHESSHWDRRSGPESTQSTA